MTAQLPPHIYPQNTPDAGTTLHTSKAIPAGELIFRVERPLASALDQARLRDTCTCCLIGREEKSLKLKFCSGCKVVGYCSKICQAESWKAHHKYECKVFNQLRPKILPKVVRIVMQLLQRRKAGSLPDDEWKSFLTLKSHVEEFKSQCTQDADGLTTWQTIQLMSKAASSYSGSRESLLLVQTITARVLLNAHTLATPTLDPIGTYLSVPASLLNHSCAPNAALTFSIHGLISIRSLSPISALSPLTIAYIDTTLHNPLRRAILLERYHFTCACSACTAPLSDPAIELSKSEFRHLLTQQPPAGTTIPDLLRAHAAFSSTTKPHQLPMPLLNQHIYFAALDAGRLRLAFTYTLIAYFFIDPVINASAWHPTSVVRTWALLRLVAAILSEQTPESLVTPLANGHLTMAGEDFDFVSVIVGLWHEVRLKVARSHGDDSSFAEEVRVWGKQHEVVESGLPDKVRKWEWGKLRALAQREYEGQGEGTAV